MESGCDEVTFCVYDFCAVRNGLCPIFSFVSLKKMNLPNNHASISSS